MLQLLRNLQWMLKRPSIVWSFFELSSVLILASFVLFCFVFLQKEKTDSVFDNQDSYNHVYSLGPHGLVVVVVLLRVRVRVWCRREFTYGVNASEEKHAQCKPKVFGEVTEQRKRHGFVVVVVVDE